MVLEETFFDDFDPRIVVGGRATIKCEYDPKLDITTYELAQLIPFILGQSLFEEDWQSLGEATRHLKRVT